MPLLPTISLPARRRSLRRPVLDVNLAHIRAESQALREDRFCFERKWQGRTTELLFYDRYLGQVVEYDFPAFGGERILPHRIDYYNKKRRQAFECWCGQYSPSCPVFVKFFTVCEGDVNITYASCHTCGLSICFNHKYYEAMKQKSYPGFHRDSETMCVPSRPENMPRDLIPSRRSYRRRPYNPAGHGTQGRARSSIGHLIADPKRYVTPPPRLSSPPTAESILRRCLGDALPPAPSRFMTLDSPSSSVMEGAIAGPSHFNGSFDDPSSAGPSGSSSAGLSNSPTKEEDDVLIYCDVCCRYMPLIHRCLSPEL